MQSIREIQEKTVGFFAGKGVPNPKLDTDLLIAHVLGIKRLELYLDLNRPLTEAELDELRPLVKRRSMREPLQYIFGRTEFCGMALKIDSRALIPRQETEELIEQICERMSSPPKRILDMGTGSGAIAIALAAAYPDAEVWATDQSEAALALAQENASKYVSDARIHFQQGSWWAAVPEGMRFDLIVSNPPYLTEAERHTAEPEVVAHEPASALVSGEDGLEDLKAILSGTKAHLAPGGLLALETGIAQHAQLDELAAGANITGEGVDDMSGRPRFYFVEDPLGADDEPGRTADASIHTTPNSSDPELKPNAVSQLSKGRISNSDTRYFITCCTDERASGLEAAPCAQAIITTLQQLHDETSIDLIAATVMPDHMHLLMKLGRRLTLPQVVGKFKSATRGALADAGLTWQTNYYDHRLRSDNALESFSKYIYLNPYQAKACETEQTWPWWVQNEAYRPEFLALLHEPPLPPAEWMRENTDLKAVIEGDL
jgi:release factor glutamine methyltransferase